MRAHNFLFQLAPPEKNNDNGVQGHSISSKTGFVTYYNLPDEWETAPGVRHEKFEGYDLYTGNIGPLDTITFILSKARPAGSCFPPTYIIEKPYNWGDGGSDGDNQQGFNAINPTTVANRNQYPGKHYVEKYPGPAYEIRYGISVQVATFRKDKPELAPVEAFGHAINPHMAYDSMLSDDPRDYLRKPVYFYRGENHQSSYRSANYVYTENYNCTYLGASAENIVEDGGAWETQKHSMDMVSPSHATCYASEIPFFMNQFAMTASAEGGENGWMAGNASGPSLDTSGQEDPVDPMYFHRGMVSSEGYDLRYFTQQEGSFDYGTGEINYGYGSINLETLQNCFYLPYDGSKKAAGRTSTGAHVPGATQNFSSSGKLRISITPHVVPIFNENAGCIGAYDINADFPLITEAELQTNGGLLYNNYFDEDAFPRNLNSTDEIHKQKHMALAAGPFSSRLDEIAMHPWLVPQSMTGTGECYDILHDVQGPMQFIDPDYVYYTQLGVDVTGRDLNGNDIHSYTYLPDGYTIHDNAGPHDFPGLPGTPLSNSIVESLLKQGFAHPATMIPRKNEKYAELEYFRDIQNVAWLESNGQVDRYVYEFDVAAAPERVNTSQPVSFDGLKNYLADSPFGANDVVKISGNYSSSITDDNRFLPQKNISMANDKLRSHLKFAKTLYNDASETLADDATISDLSTSAAGGISADDFRGQLIYKDSINRLDSSGGNTSESLNPNDDFIDAQYRFAYPRQHRPAVDLDAKDPAIDSDVQPYDNEYYYDRPIPIIPGSYSSVLGGSHKPNPAFLTKGSAAFFTIDPGEGNMTVGNRASTAALNNNYGLPAGRNLSNTKYYGYISADGGSWLYNDEWASLTNGPVNDSPDRYGINLPNYYPEFYKPKIGQYCDEFIEYASYRDRTSQSHLHANALLKNPDPECEWFGRWDNIMDHYLQRENHIGTNAAGIDNNEFNTLGYYTTYDSPIDDETDEPGGVHWYNTNYSGSVLYGDTVIPKHTEWEWRKSHNQNEDLSGWQAPEIYAMYWAPITPSLKGDGFFDWPSFTIMVEGIWQKDDFKQLTISSGTKAHQQHTYRTDWKCDHQIIQTGAYFQSIQESADENRNNVLNDARPKAPITVWRWGYESKLETTPEHSKDSIFYYSRTNPDRWGNYATPHKHPLFSRRPEYLTQNELQAVKTSDSELRPLIRKMQKVFCDMGTWKPVTVDSRSDVEWSGTNPDININPFLVEVEDQIAQGLPSTLHNKVTVTMYQKEDPFYGIGASSSGPQAFQDITTTTRSPEPVLVSKPKTKTLKLPSAKEASRLSGRQWISGTYAFSYDNPTYDQISSDSLPSWVPDTFDSSSPTSYLRSTITGFNITNVSEEFQSPGSTITDNFFYANEPTGSTWPNGSGMTNNIHLRYNGFYVDTTKALAIRPLSGIDEDNNHPSGDNRQHVGETFQVNRDTVIGAYRHLNSRLEVLDDIGNTYLLQYEVRHQASPGIYTFSPNALRLQYEGNQVEAIETEDGNFEDSNKWTYYTGAAAVFPDAEAAPFDGNNPNSVYYSQGLNTGSADDNVAYDSSLTYKWYKLSGGHVEHATNEAEMDTKFDDSSGNVTFGGDGQWDTTINWHEAHGGQDYPDSYGTYETGSQIKPDFLPDDDFSLEISGTITAPETGTYTFKIVSDDAGDVFIDSINVVNHYGGHGAVYANGPEGTIDLEGGRTYNFKTRVQEHVVLDGQMLFWKKPSDTDFEIIPISAFYKGGNVTVGTARDTMAVSNYADANFENATGTWLNSTPAALYTYNTKSLSSYLFAEIANPDGLETSNGSACLVLSTSDVSSDWGPNVNAERFNFGRTNYPDAPDGSYYTNSTYSQNTLTFNSNDLEIAVGRRLAFHGHSAYVNAQNNVFTAVISKVVYNTYKSSPHAQKIIVYLDNVEVINQSTQNDSSGQPIYPSNWFNPALAEDIDFVGNLDNYPSSDYISNSVNFKAQQIINGNFFAEGGHWRGNSSIDIDYTKSVAGIVPAYYYSFGSDLGFASGAKDKVENPALQDKFLIEGSIYLHDPGDAGHPPNGSVYLGVAAYNQADGDQSSNINIADYTDGSQWWYPVLGMNTNNLQTNKWYHFSFPFRLTDPNGINDNVKLGEELQSYGPALPWNASAIRALAILNYQGTEGKMYAQNVRIRRINNPDTASSDSTDIESYGVKKLAHQSREHNPGIYDPMLPQGWLTGNMYDYRAGIANKEDINSNNYELLDFNGAPEIFRDQTRDIWSEISTNSSSGLVHTLDNDHYTDATLSQLGKPWVDTPSSTISGINSDSVSVGTGAAKAMWHVADGQQLPGIIFTETRFQGEKIQIANDADIAFNTLSLQNSSFWGDTSAIVDDAYYNQPAYSGELMHYHDPEGYTNTHIMTATNPTTLDNVKSNVNFFLDRNTLLTQKAAAKKLFESYMYPASHEDDTIGDFSTRTERVTNLNRRIDTKPNGKNMSLNDWSLTTGLIDNKAHHGSDSLRDIKNAMPYTLDRQDNVSVISDGSLTGNYVNITQLIPDMSHWLSLRGFTTNDLSDSTLWSYMAEEFALDTNTNAEAELAAFTASMPIIWPYGLEYESGSTKAQFSQGKISQQMYSTIAANAKSGPNNTIRGSLDSSRYFHKKSYTAESWYELDSYTIQKNKMNRYLTLGDDLSTYTNKYDELTREIVTEDWGGQTSQTLETLGYLPHLKDGLYWNLMRKVKLKTKVGRRVVISFRIYNEMSTQNIAMTNPVDRNRTGQWWVKYHKDGDPTFRPNTWIRNVEARHTGPGSTTITRVTNQTTTSTQANNLISPNPSYTGWIEFEYEEAAANGTPQAYLYDVNRPFEHNVATSPLNANEWYQCSVSIEITQEMLGSNIDLAFYATGGRIEDIPADQRDIRSGIIQGVTVEISENQMEDD